ncbi:hypothetical protein SISSUDRAFT_1048837 [Sistotremastrum suecicum HHB10207 ss-3]|uniref:Uncharacterized protein n=1 Tax=Sistotremastrum suecicum HHB10207 ss-3 TaxID=1314776 RepID=A0A166C8A1_9AGAM|nr:hypothetical protein SISSUDRAFT_1048837 [Sistotremastrum suecicum HHB10207 ss-3]
MSSAAQLNGAGYDVEMLRDAPEVTKAQKQEGYNPDLLESEAERETSGGHGVLSTPPERLQQLDPEKNVSTQEYPQTRSTSTRIPFWRTTKGIIIIIVAIIVVLAAVLGGALGGTLHKKNNNSSSSGGAGLQSAGGISVGSTSSTGSSSPSSSSGSSSSSTPAPGPSATPTSAAGGPGVVTTSTPT